MFLSSEFGLRHVKILILVIATVFGPFFAFNVYYSQIQKDFHFITYEPEPQYQLRESFSSKSPGLQVLSFPFDAKCLQTAGEDNIKIEKEKEDFEFLKSEQGRGYKKILFYYHAYQNNNWFGAGHKIFEKSCCKEKRCFLTDKSDLIPFKEFDAILIQHSGFDPNNLPQESDRTSNQKWIFIELEAAAYFGKGLEKYSNIFNWTMTYRRDSDVPFRYGYVYPRKDLPLKSFYLMERNYTDVETLIKGKKKLAVWLVSHCLTYGGREIFVEELQKYIQVDIYGRCGPLNCSHSEDCYEKFEKEYKFYFSFENSICHDYITEKLFNVIRYYMVPVVFGAGDYSAVSPPHSYINVKNFENAKSLANYLLYLDSNDTAYKEYFKWKEDYISTEENIMRAVNLCMLCEKLHTTTETKIYSDMTDWYLKKSNCLFCGKIPPRNKIRTKCFNTLQEYLKRHHLIPVT